MGDCPQYSLYDFCDNLYLVYAFLMPTYPAALYRDGHHSDAVGIQIVRQVYPEEIHTNTGGDRGEHTTPR